VNLLRRRLAAPLALLVIALQAAAAQPAWAHGKRHSLVAKSGRAKGGDFTLRSASGPVALASLRGKVVTIYFSYLHCADICPTYLAALAQALRSLAPAEAAQVQPVFVTLDPERDGERALAEYAAAFHPSLIGLTGGKEEIAALARAYGVLQRRHAAAGGGYDIDHSSLLHVVGRDGALRERLPHDATVAQIAAALRRGLAR
jgi:protein SCO1/2